MVIVVNLAMGMPASRRSDMENLITASFDDDAVAGPYIYFTVARASVWTMQLYNRLGK
jgi:hypothetical protein